MGSEMCIRDSGSDEGLGERQGPAVRWPGRGRVHPVMTSAKSSRCLLYTSDAADERSSVDLGGRRIIKKNKSVKYSGAPANERPNRTDACTYILTTQIHE